MLAACVAVAYFLVPVLLLRFALDRLLFPLANGSTTHEDRMIDVPLTAGRSIRIRQYGNSARPHCVIFFPGMHGGISTYERTLFPNIEELGITVYALSYPGHDGAQGRNHVTTFLQDVHTALTTIQNGTTCQPDDAVFVGRSQGASVALYTAQRFRPKGLLLDGVAPSVTVAVRAAMRRHIATRPWALLPLPAVMKEDFEIRPVIQSLRPIPVVIFQGTEDEVTPFAETQNAVRGQDNVQFVAVPGGTHGDVYLLAMPQYLEMLAELVRQ